MEQGRTVPTAEQFEAVWKALGGSFPDNMTGTELRGTVVKSVEVRAPLEEPRPSMQG
jgi:hypothetical protein